MGKLNAQSNNSQIWQQLTQVLGDGSSGGIWSTPAYFNGTVYYGPSGGNLLAFPLGSARLAASPSSASSARFPYPGTFPAVSANGASNGIVWAPQNTNPAAPYAFDAGSLGAQLHDRS